MWGTIRTLVSCGCGQGILLPWSRETHTCTGSSAFVSGPLTLVLTTMSSVRKADVAGRQNLGLGRRPGFPKCSIQFNTQVQEPAGTFSGDREWQMSFLRSPFVVIQSTSISQKEAFTHLVPWSGGLPPRAASWLPDSGVQKNLCTPGVYSWGCNNWCHLERQSYPCVVPWARGRLYLVWLWQPALLMLVGPTGL